MSTELLLGLLTAAVALSGWGTLWYQHWLAKPKLGGGIIQVMRGQFTAVGKERTSFLGYVTLTNLRPLPNQIIDFEMQVKTQGDWNRLERIFQHPGGKPLTFQFGQAGVPIPREQFLDRAGRVEMGKALNGFVLFFGDADLYHVDPTAYRLTVIDVFGKRHLIEVDANSFRSPHLMGELSGVDFSAAIAIQPGTK